jgi:hypothetical protein
MPVEGREKGIRSPYTVVFGLTHPTYAGVNTQQDPAALTDVQGPLGINLRIVGGRPVSRGGQEKTNATPLPEIHGFFDSTVENL